MSVSWTERNQIIALFIPKGSSVLDLGAGDKDLLKYLDCRYVGYDIHPQDPSIGLCDFNHNVPTVCGFDFVVVSGVLEYLNDPKGFIQSASKLGKKMIVTYAVREDGQTIESRKGWVNHLTKSGIESMFYALGLSYKVIGNWYEQQIWMLK